MLKTLKEISEIKATHAEDESTYQNSEEEGALIEIVA